MRCKDFCFPEKEQEGKEGEFVPGQPSPGSSPPSALAHSATFGRER